MGTVAQHSERPLQVWPEPKQVGGARQTPEASRDVPAQQSASLFARMPSDAQAALHVGAPVAVEARQYGALAQHGVAADRHDAPDDRQLAGARQMPAASSSSPEQQSSNVAAIAPAGAQVALHEVAEVAEVPRQKFSPAQHSLELPQVAPVAAQVGAGWQTPPEQVSPLQQIVAPPQV